MEKRDSNSTIASSQTSRVNNGGAKYQNVGTVYNAPVIKQTVIKDTSITYEVDQEDLEGMESLSLLVMKLLGERNTKITAAVAVPTGAAAFYASQAKLPLVITPFAPYLMYFGILSILLAATLITALRYKYNSRCVKCNTFYAMREIGSPKTREAEVRGGTQYTTKRTYKCKHCGNQTARTTNHFEQNEQIDGELT